MTTATISTSITSKSSNLESTIREVFKLSIYYFGINRKCRKAQRHSYHFRHEIPYKDLTETEINEIKALILGHIQTNVKELQSEIQVRLEHTVISHENGFTCQQWEPFSNKHIKFSIA